MEEVYIGKIVSFHGVKGEIRILSDFPYKDQCFMVGKELLIDQQPYQITSYRVHKQYDMITLAGFHDKNQVLPFRGKKVYQAKEVLGLSTDQFLMEDVLQCAVQTTDGRQGKILEIFDAGGGNQVLRIDLEGQNILVPLQKQFIKTLDIKKQMIIIDLWEGMGS